MNIEEVKKILSVKIKLNNKIEKLQRDIGNREISGNAKSKSEELSLVRRIETLL